MKRCLLRHDIKTRKINHCFLMCHWHILCGLWDWEREQYSFYSGSPSCYCRIPFDQKEVKGICEEKTIMEALAFDAQGNVKVECNLAK